MKNLDSWFNEYSKSHQHPLNIKIHYICVPLIAYSTLAIIDALSLYLIPDLPFSLVYLVIFLCGLFYLNLDVRLGFILMVSTLLMVFSFQIFSNPKDQFFASVIVFLISWLFQFIGHKYEGAKPSFLKDITFLLIGPLWVLAKISNKNLRRPS